MPVEVVDWDDLDDIRLDLDGDYVLVNDIDESSDGYSGTGDSWVTIQNFNGSIDGDGHYIGDLTIDVNSTLNGIGFLGSINGTVTISNLGLQGGSVSNSGFLTVGNMGVGSFVGRSSGSLSMTNCYNRGCDVSISGGADFFGTTYAGGLVGYRVSGTVEIDKCYAACQVSSTNTAPDMPGGAVAAGIIAISSDVDNTFWDTDVGPGSSSGGGTGKTTTQMKDIDTYTDTATTGLDEAWDFDDLWAISSGVNEGYPYFQTDGLVLIDVTKLPGSSESVGGGGDEEWEDVENIQDEEDYAYVPNRFGLNDNRCDKLQGTGFGFDIPSGSTIKGIKFEYKIDHTFGERSQEVEVKLIKDGSLVGDDKSEFDNMVGTVIHGNDDDLWGATWTPGDINDEDFGVSLELRNRQEVMAGYEPKIYWFEITVYYEDGELGALVQIKRNGSFEEKSLMIKKSGEFEPASNIQGGGW